MQSYVIEKTMEINTSSSHDILATRLAALQQTVKAVGSASRLVSRGLTPPTLIAVSKTHPTSLIEEAIALGVTDFGENKVQEAAAKYPALKANYPHIKLHLIGSLQSNKAKEAVALFDVIHTIDRPKIADAIRKEVTSDGWQATDTDKKSSTLLIQVNIGEEPQKAGVSPRDLPALLTHCHIIGLPISGLMCIPPEGENPAPYFALMQQFTQTYQFTQLSMGMSSDYKTALRFGATMIRVGTALFGERAR